MGSLSEFLWTEEGFEEKTYADGAVLRDGQKNSAGKPLAVLESQTGRTVFFPSEARSLAAALTAWADRVEPVRERSNVSIEVGGETFYGRTAAEPQRPEDPFRHTDVDGDALCAYFSAGDIGRAAGTLVLTTGREDRSGERTVLLPPTVAGRLAAFLTRREAPSAPGPCRSVDNGASESLLCHMGCGKPRHTGFSCAVAGDIVVKSLERLDARIDGVVKRLNAWEEADVVAAYASRLATLEAARDALKDVLTVQADHDSRINSLAGMGGGMRFVRASVTETPNPILAAAIKNARFMDECATDDYGSDRCEATEDGVRCLLGGGTCAGDHVFPEGAEIRAGLVKALATEVRDEATDDEILLDRVKALEDYYAGLPGLKDRMQDVERWIRGGVDKPDAYARIVARVPLGVKP